MNNMKMGGVGLAGMVRTPLSGHAGRQAGFTLIELIMVIVVLGILAAFALPRFANLSGDARVATLNGAAGAMRSSIAIARSAALVAVPPKTGATGTVDMDGATVSLVYGSPAASDLGIVRAAQLSANDFQIVSSGGTTTVRPNGVSASSTTCVATYTQPAAAGGVGTVTVAAGNCNN